MFYIKKKYNKTDRNLKYILARCRIVQSCKSVYSLLKSNQHLITWGVIDEYLFNIGFDFHRQKKITQT